MGNTILVVSGFFKEDAVSTAADKMMRVLEAEAWQGTDRNTLHSAIFPTMKFIEFNAYKVAKRTVYTV